MTRLNFAVWALFVISTCLFIAAVTGHMRTSCDNAKTLDPAANYDYVCAIAFKR